MVRRRSGCVVEPTNLCEACTRSAVNCQVRFVAWLILRAAVSRKTSIVPCLITWMLKLKWVAEVPPIIPFVCRAAHLDKQR